MAHMPPDLAEQHRRQQGDRIKAARLNAWRTQREVVNALNAAGCNVTVQALSLWERGERFPSHPNQVALATVLGVGWADLFGPNETEAA
jgi:transcriptional regulator with XRE-family HTH domain